VDPKVVAAEIAAAAQRRSEQMSRVNAVRRGGLSDPAVVAAANAAAAAAAAAAVPSSDGGGGEDEPDSDSETLEWLELPGGNGGGGGGSSSSSSSGGENSDDGGDASSSSSSSSSSDDEPDLSDDEPDLSDRTMMGLQRAAAKDESIVSGQSVADDDESLPKSPREAQEQRLRVVEAERRIRARASGSHPLLAVGASTRVPGLPRESGGGGGGSSSSSSSNGGGRVSPELAALMILECAAGAHEFGYGPRGRQRLPPFRSGGPADCAIHYAFGVLMSVTNRRGAAVFPEGLRARCQEQLGGRVGVLELFRIARRSRVALHRSAEGGAEPLPTAKKEAQIALVLLDPRSCLSASASAAAAGSASASASTSTSAAAAATSADASTATDADADAAGLLLAALASVLPTARTMMFHVLRVLVDQEDARRVHDEALSYLAGEGGDGAGGGGGKEDGEEKEKDKDKDKESDDGEEKRTREMETAMRDLVLADFGSDAAGLERADVLLNAFDYYLPEPLVGEVVCTVEETARGSASSGRAGTAVHGTACFRKGPVRAPAAALLGDGLTSSSFPRPVFDPAEARRRLACRGGRAAFERAFRTAVDAAGRWKEVLEGSGGGGGGSGSGVVADFEEVIARVLAEAREELRERDRLVKGKAAKFQQPSVAGAALAASAASAGAAAPASAAAGAATPPPPSPPPPAAAHQAALRAVGDSAYERARRAGLSDAQAGAALAQAVTEAHAAAAAKAAATAAATAARNKLVLSAWSHLGPIERNAVAAAAALGAPAQEAAAAGKAAIDREVASSPWLQGATGQVRLWDAEAAAGPPGGGGALPLEAYVREVRFGAVRRAAAWEHAVQGKRWAAVRGMKGAAAMNVGAGPSDAE
jgi:hypothetical protein